MLQEQVNRLQKLIEMSAPIPTELQMATVAEPPAQNPPQQGGQQNQEGNGGRGDGLSEGWEDPFKKGPNSKEWKKWISNPKNYHRNNPHPVGTPKFYQWEWEYYETPPV